MSYQVRTLNQDEALLDLVNFDDNQKFPESPNEILNYLQQLSNEFENRGIKKVKEVINIEVASFQSYLNCKIQIMAIDENDRYGFLVFSSDYEFKKYHTIDINWNYEL